MPPLIDLLISRMEYQRVCVCVCVCDEGSPNILAGRNVGIEGITAISLAGTTPETLLDLLALVALWLLSRLH